MMRKSGLYKNMTYYAIGIALCLWLVIGFSPVTAATNSALPLAQGQTVFIGEQNVVISSAAIITPNSVGYFNSTSNFPEVTETLAATDSFTSAAHGGFSSAYLGNWYVVNPNGQRGALAFTLASPSMTGKST